jgi:glycosyltransferase involved in cell wall biosynthesis
MDLVSIIMPCFNSEKFIEESVQSVIDQSYAHWELLICDDESDDNSKEIIMSFVNLDSRIKLVSNYYSKGAPGARNSCLDEAQGRYIAFLDSDDIWLPEKLYKQLSFMNNNNFSFTYSYYETMNVQGEVKSLCKSPNSVNFKKMTICNFIGCLTAIYDSKLIGKCYQPTIKKRNDYALWLAILRKDKNLKAYCFNEVTSRYRVNDYGLSSNKLSALKYYRLCLRDYASFGEFKIFFHCIFYLLLILVKKKNPQLYNSLVSKI